MTMSACAKTRLFNAPGPGALPNGGTGAPAEAPTKSTATAPTGEKAAGWGKWAAWAIVLGGTAAILRASLKVK